LVNSSSSSITQSVDIENDTNRVFDATFSDDIDYINYDALEKVTSIDPLKTGNRRKKNKRNHTAVPKISYGATDYLEQVRPPLFFKKKKKK
jgi:hypothetical protein